MPVLPWIWMLLLDFTWTIISCCGVQMLETMWLQASFLETSLCDQISSEMCDALYRSLDEEIGACTYCHIIQG